MKDLHSEVLAEGLCFPEGPRWYDGKLWLSDMYGGRVVVVTPEGEARSVGDEVRFPNGTVITPDGRSLIVAESFATRLTKFDIEPNGSLVNGRPFAKLPKGKLRGRQAFEPRHERPVGLYRRQLSGMPRQRVDRHVEQLGRCLAASAVGPN